MSMAIPSGPQCLCEHSATAHFRGTGHACSFCDCAGYSVGPFVVDRPPAHNQTDEVSLALAKLGQHPAFAAVLPAHLAALAGRGRRRLFMAGSTLMDKGDSSDCLYLLLKGAVRVERPATGLMPVLEVELGAG